MDQLAGGLNVIESDPTKNPYNNRYTDDITMLVGGIPRRPALGGVLDIEFFYRLNHQNKPDILIADSFHINGQSKYNPVVVPMQEGVTKRYFSNFFYFFTSIK